MYPRPFGDRVLVRQDSKKDRLESGLYVPDSAEHALWNNYAEVLAVGEGRRLPSGRLEPLDVKVGDRVLFKRAPGTALVADFREGDPEGWADLLMLREDDIIGVVEQ